VAEAGVTLRLATPAALWALVAVPLFLGRRARVAGVLRALAAATLIVVLAGPSVERLRPAAGACVVAAVDVSTSVEHAVKLSRCSPTFSRRLTVSVSPFGSVSVSVAG